MAAALVAEALIRWPHGLPHPVVWIGRLISVMERAWNKADRSEYRKRAMGVLSVLILLSVTACIGLGITRLSQLLPRPWPSVIMVACGVCGLAAGSLWHHVRAIDAPLYRWDIASARKAVGMIVGRDTHDMNEPDIATAAIESLAESFNDGVVAPVFWFLLAGLPGLFAYKAINTADSMIGHMEPRWRAFGWAGAKTDDLMNWIPARIAGSLIALAGTVTGSGLKGWQVMRRDARKHASPNAGWTEAAMAGALGVRLGGEVRYDGQIAMRPMLGEGEPPKAQHLKQALRLYLLACGMLLALILIGGVAWPR
ncbi:adenosylcobinamide-phosphate synthase CbiB [Brevundimonas vesicularis]|uniref:adenosylcobinamide-phosphate synthase CbiB n=1 Tax=Brevundimonas vesicularis TaxID=41276 RepID=UPI0038D464B3